MTWRCPYCDTAYPDSALGLPLGADADDKEYCTNCMIAPQDIEAVIEDLERRDWARWSHPRDGMEESVKALREELPQGALQP